MYRFTNRIYNSLETEVIQGKKKKTNCEVMVLVFVCLSGFYLSVLYVIESV